MYKRQKPILIFFGMSVATTIYTNLDTVMLKFMQGNEAAGYYTAAVKVKTVLVGVVTSIGLSLIHIYNKDGLQFTHGACEHRECLCCL